MANDPLDDWLARQDQDEQPASLGQSTFTQTQTPDEAAQDHALAQQVGVPTPQVRAERESYARIAEGLALDRSTAQTPRLRGWLANPSNLEVARDDVHNLATFERQRTERTALQDSVALSALALAPGAAIPYIWNRLTAAPGDFWGNRQQELGEQDIEFGNLGVRAARAVRGQGPPLTEEEWARIVELQNRADEGQGTFIIGPTRRMLPQLGGQIERGYRQMGARIEEQRNTVYGTPARALEGPNDPNEFVVTGQRDRQAEQRGRAMADALFNVTAPWAAAGGAGGGFLSFVNDQEEGSAYLDMLQQGADPVIAARRAQEYGAAAVAIEFVSDVTGLKVSSAARLASRMVLRETAMSAVRRPLLRAGEHVAGTVAEQGLEESFQQLAQIIHTDLALQETQSGHSDIGQAWASAISPEHIQQILQAGYIGAQGGFGFGAVPSSVNYGMDMHALRQADHAAAVFEQQTRAAQASKLVERGLHGTLESAIGAMDESNVFIDADQWVEHFQSAGQDAYRVADELGIGADTLAQALASHGQVQMPTARFAARLLAIPEHAKLAEHARIDPVSDTPAEAKIAGERMQALAEKMAEENVAAQEESSIGDAVETRMREILAQAEKEGGPRREVAAQYAKLVSSLPRAVIARAMQADPAYGQKLAARFQELFGSNLDVQGPARANAAMGGAEYQQRRPDGEPTKTASWNPPKGIKLSERERQITEMAANGAGNLWIADEMEVSASNVASVLRSVKRLMAAAGHPAPWEASVLGALPGKSNGEATARTEDILSLRSALRKQGYSNVYEIIAERLFPGVDTAVAINRIKNRVAKQNAKSRAPETGTSQFANRKKTGTGGELSQLLGPLSNDADQEALERASEMEDVGYTPREIWQETGWWKSPQDGKWRYELNDDKANFIVNPENGPVRGKLVDVLRFPELFAAYPALKDVNVALDLSGAEERATGSTREDSIKVAGPNKVAIMSVLLHEVQHVIQAIEGFATGGTAEAAKGQHVFEFMDELEKVRQEAIDEHFGGSRERYDRSETIDPGLHWSVEKMLQEKAATRLYLRLHGEIEARNVQRRRGESISSMPPAKRMTAEQRKATPPDETADIPYIDGILQFDQGSHLVALKSVAEEAGSGIGRVLGEPPQASEAGAGVSEQGARGNRPAGKEDAAGVREARDFAPRRDLDDLAQELAEVNQIDGQEGARAQALGGMTPILQNDQMVQAVIRLYSHADGTSYNLSTFLHETGHLFLEIFRGFANEAEAPAEFKAMWADTLDWFGVSQEQWNALSPEQRVPYHEKWAETFERYLLEGKAPSLRLRDSFAIFKRWLTDVYRSVAQFMARRPDAKLTPEISNVFDRLLATDQEMAEARAAMGSDFTLAREAFKTDEEFQAYQAAIAEAREAQDAELRARTMEAYARKSKRWWRGVREQARPAATRAVDSDKARRALEWLAFNEVRPLPSTELSDEGETGYVASADAMEAMPEDLPEMKLSAEAIAQDWPEANLPTALKPRTDAETVLAEAMQLKAQGKGRGKFRAVRFARFIKDNGGIDLSHLTPEERAPFEGFGRKRPGVINNASGKTPEELLRLATEAGYFGQGAATEYRQNNTPPDGPDAGTRGGENAWREHLRSEGFDVETPLYHGTDAAFENFNPRRAGAASSNRYPGNPVFLTDNAGSASDYAMQRDPAWDALARPNVRPVFARLRNPLVIDAEGKGYGAVTTEAIRQARTGGHDGVIIRNVLDSAGPRGRNVPQTVYAIFERENIAPRFGAVPNELATNGTPVANKLTPPQSSPRASGGEQFVLTEAPTLAGKEGHPAFELEMPEVTAAARGKLDSMAHPRAVIQFDRTPEGYRIFGVRVPDSAQGQGHGLALYEELIRRAAAEGLPVLSDKFAVTPAARNVYAALERRGYVVERDATGRPLSVRGPTPRVPDGGSARVEMNAAVEAARSLNAKKLTVQQAVTDSFNDSSLSGFVVTHDGAIWDVGEANHLAWLEAIDVEAKMAEHVAGGGIRRADPLVDAFDKASAVRMSTFGDSLALTVPQDLTARARETAIAVVRRREREAPGGDVFLEFYGTKKAGVRGAAGVERALRDMPEIPTQREPNGRSDGGELFQSNTRSRPAPVFVSEVARSLERSTTQRASGAQWLATIRKTPGVKKEELEWMGLEDFLKAQEGPVSREDVLAFVRENGVTVEETVLGGDGLSVELQAKLLPLVEERDRLMAEWSAIQSRAPQIAATREKAAYRHFTNEQKARLEEIGARQREIEPQILDLENQRSRSKGTTRWSQYQLPGGENYRELVLSVPGIEPFEPDDTVHFGNVSGGRVVAWTRYNERVDVNGLRTLQIEEFQSRRHQFGRDYGYKGDAEFRRIEKKLLDAGIEQMTLDALLEQGRGVTDSAYEKIREVLTAEELQRLREETGTQRMPDAPFKDNAWAGLALKRMIRWAAENGFDQITWTRGQHQIDRYNLAHALGDLEAERVGDGLVSFTPENGRRDARQALQRFGKPGSGGNTIMTREQAMEAFGKETGARLFDAAYAEPRTFMGEDLKVGGKGMYAFYDRILPNIANDLGKKFGARVGETDIDVTPKPGRMEFTVLDPQGQSYDAFDSLEAARQAARDAGKGYRVQEGFETVHSLPITPQMREAVLSEGQQLFQADRTPSDKAPTLEEFLSTLAADLRNERAVYSAKDQSALAGQQDLEDARAWFDAHGIDLSKDKEAIRAQIVEALEKDKNDPNAAHPDDIAPWFGFSSGDEMVQALSALKPRNVAIEEEIDRRVGEEYGDAASPDKIKAEAEKAAHAAAQARRIEVELAAIQKATGGRIRPMSAAAKAAAYDQIENMTLREIRRPEVFLAGERRAARTAMEAAVKQDWPEAERQKSKQMMSFWLYTAAREAADTAEKIERRWKHYSTNQSARKAIGPRHIEQIDAILDQVETGKPQFRPEQSLGEWAEGLKQEGAEDLLVFEPAVIEQQIKRPLSQMSFAEVKGLNDVLRNIETIGRGMIKLRNAKEAQRIADIQAELKARIVQEWAPQLAKKRSLVAPNAADKAGIELQHIDAQLLKLDYLARLLDGLKDGGPWMRIMGMAQEAENDLQARSQNATQQFLAIARDHYTPKQFRELLSKRIFIPAIDDNRTKAQIISAALNVGNEYNRDALLKGEGWSMQQLSALLSNMTDADWKFVQALWDYVGQWKEESFALDERTRGSRPPEVQATPFTTPKGLQMQGGYWPVSFSTSRSDRAAAREARETVIGEYGGGFRQAATNRGRLKARVGTGGQPLSDDFMSVLAKHVNDSLRDITHRDLVIMLRRVKADPELRNMIARVRGRDAVRALDEWVHRLSARTPANVFGDYGRIAAYLRRASTSHAMGFKVSVATLNLLGHLQAIPRNGVVAQMKQAGLSVAVGFPDLLRRHAMAFATGEKEVSSRVQLVYDKSEMMRHRRNTFDRDINEVKGDLVGRREGSVLPKRFEDVLQYLNAYTDQVISIPTWLAAYESAKNSKVDGVEGEKASVEYADSVVRMTLSAGGTKDMAALIASNNQWQRLMTMFMGWASAFYGQMFTEQIPGVMSGKISIPKFAANMVWIWMLPAIITTIFYGQGEKRDDEDEWQYWARMAATGLTYPLQTIPLVRDMLSTLVQGYRPQTPVTAVMDRSQKLASAVERQDERQMIKQGFMLVGQLTGIPAQAYTTGDYVGDLIAGEEHPADDPVDALQEMLIRDER